MKSFGSFLWITKILHDQDLLRLWWVFWMWLWQVWWFLSIWWHWKGLFGLIRVRDSWFAWFQLQTQVKVTCQPRRIQSFRGFQFQHFLSSLSNRWFFLELWLRLLGCFSMLVLVAELNYRQLRDRTRVLWTCWVFRTLHGSGWPIILLGWRSVHECTRLQLRGNTFALLEVQKLLSYLNQ